MASVAGHVGCLTLVVIFIALFAGLWLDRYLDTKPLFTILMMIGSMPVTLFLMFRVVKAATDRIKPSQSQKSSEEEPNLGKEEITFMVNQKQASLETALHNKDEIALLYLIGGG